MLERRCWGPGQACGEQLAPQSSQTRVFLTGMTSAHEQTEPGEKQGRTDDCFRSDRSQLLSDSPRQYPHSTELGSLGYPVSVDYLSLLRNRCGFVKSPVPGCGRGEGAVRVTEEEVHGQVLLTENELEKACFHSAQHLDVHAGPPDCQEPALATFSFHTCWIGPRSAGRVQILEASMWIQSQPGWG